jgi:glutamine amidotransferase
MIIIVDYGVGNIASLTNMLHHVGGASMLSRDPDVIATAKKILLPGVGAFGNAMAALRAAGLADAIITAASSGADLLGVCLGMQLLGRRSEEGNVDGLGLIPADIKRIAPSDDGVKVPNMGWREVNYTRDHWLAPSKGTTTERFYFAHSYHMVCDDGSAVIATVDYDGPKTVAVSVGSVHGVQYHPEKSHRFGMRLLAEFTNI